MTVEALPIFAACLLGIAAFWSLPGRYAQDGFAAISLLGLAYISPLSAAWMLGSIVVMQQLMILGEKLSRKGLVAVIGILALCIAFFISRDSKALLGSSWAIVGIAYSTLRHIHVLMEHYLGRIPAPSLQDYLRYHLLLPVVIAGPIHRLPHFQRQCERRRWSVEEFFSGAERALLGFALAVIVGEYLGSRAEAFVGATPDSSFLQQWVASALDWLRLYARFEGLTSIALGFCLMIGLRLEENFNQPWRARNLVDFWTRWHMTLSLWCRDYVYLPIAAIFRSALVGIFSAMLVLGLWHETSLYYVLWAFYQATGIVLSQLYIKTKQRLRFSVLPEAIAPFVTPMLILAWLASARPVILLLLGAMER